MDDLEEVVRGDFQHADQRLLNGRGHVGETLLVVSTFEHMNFCEWHFRISLFTGHESRLLKSLERKRDALPAADAQRHDAALQMVTLHRVQ